MWWRFLTFCILVSLILMLVLSYLHGRPVVHLFYKRCCDGDIENEEVIFETFSNNFLKERMVAFEAIESNGTFVPADVEVQEMIDLLRKKINVHNLESRKKLIEQEEEKEELAANFNVNDYSSEKVTERTNASDFAQYDIVSNSVNETLDVNDS